MVAIKFYSEVLEAERNKAYEELAALYELPGVLRMYVGKQVRVEEGYPSEVVALKGFHLGLVAMFANEEELRRFRENPRHQVIANHLARIADWVTVDFYVG